jgi:hypothetical protein
LVDFRLLPSKIGANAVTFQLALTRPDRLLLLAWAIMVVAAGRYWSEDLSSSRVSHTTIHMVPATSEHRMDSEQN